MSLQWSKVVSFWGLRVLIPFEYRERLLTDLHGEHPGMSRMKALARGFLWWPKLDHDIEQLVRDCVACQSVRQMPQTATVHPYRWPERPWARVHIDFAEKDGQSFLLVHDSHSKWLEVIHCSDTTAARTVSLLRSLFARYGLPETLVSDNGPQFVSEEFQKFLKSNGIRHVLTPPYHPASNGAAERAVRVLKESLMKQLKAMEQSGRYKTLQHRLDNFLLGYRSTPHSVTGRSPSEMFLGRRMRTRLSLLFPQVRETVERAQERQVSPSVGAATREFALQQKVLVRNHRGREKWVFGTVLSRKGPLTYLVSVLGRARLVHVDQMVARSGDQSESSPTIPMLSGLSMSGSRSGPAQQPECSPTISLPPPADALAQHGSPLEKNCDESRETQGVTQGSGQIGSQGRGIGDNADQRSTLLVPRRSDRMNKGIPAKRLGFE